MQLVYKAGKDMYIPDTLSRAALPCKTPASDDWEAQVHLIIDSLPISDEKLKLFQQETAKDAVLQLLRRHILEGWPDHKKDAPEEIREYTGFRDELSEKDGLIFKGEQLIVPKSLQSDMLQRLHQGHMGRDKCLATAKQVFFWIGMSVQITDLVTRCAVCKKFQNAQQKEPLMSHVVPSLPWEKLAADLFQFDGKNYLLIVDYYSKFCEVSPLKESTRSADVILAMKSQFARHGIPKELITDNGPQFSCTEFARFVSAWDFRHMTSSPKYPRSNGLAERNVQTIKNLLRKAKAVQQDPYIALLQLRTTPLPDSVSPAQLLMNRRLRTRLPTTDAFLKPSVPPHEQVQQAMRQRQMQQAQDYNKTALPKPLPHLKPGEIIRMQMAQDSTWKPAVVVSTAPQPRSYFVRTEDGATYRRNRAMLRQTQEPLVPPSPPQAEGPDTVRRPARPAIDDVMPPAAAEPTRAPPPGTTVTRYGRHSKPPDRYTPVK